MNEYVTVILMMFSFIGGMASSLGLNKREQEDIFNSGYRRGLAVGKVMKDENR